MIVELVGPMGIGKSTLAKSTIQELHNLGISCPSQDMTSAWRSSVGLSSKPNRTSRWHFLEDKTALSYPIGLFKSPMLSAASYAAALTTRPLSRAAVQSSKAVSKWKSLFDTNAIHSDYDAIILDEGPLQYSTSMLLRTDRWSTSAYDFLVYRIMKHFKHYVVFVNCDLEVNWRRLQERHENLAGKLKGWRFSSEDKEFERKKFTHMVAVFLNLHHTISLKHPEHLLADVDATMDSMLETNSRYIANLVVSNGKASSH